MMVLRKLLFWSAAVIFPLPLVLVYNASAREPDGLKFYITLGFIAYSWWLLSVLLSVRPPWLDRAVGLSSIYGLHATLGILALVLAFVHRDNSYSGNALAILLGNWSFYTTVVLVFYALFFMSGWLVDRVRVLLVAKQLLEVVFRHRVSVWIHRANLAVIVMIWLHAHLLVRVNQYFAFMTLLDVYTVAVFGVYVWKKWIAPDNYATGGVISNEPLGDTSSRISIDLDRTATTLQPGDSYFLRFEGTPHIGREWHPFSVTDANRTTLTFTIRHTGDFTRQLPAVRAGTRVRLEGPFGRFDSIVQGYTAQTPLVLVGMGAGVAPLLSLVAAHHGTRPIHLLWSVRNPEDAYYRDLIERQRAASNGRMAVTIQVGRFSRDQLRNLLPGDEITRGAFFVVGPNPAVLGTERALRKIGVSASRIHQERLTM